MMPKIVKVTNIGRLKYKVGYFDTGNFVMTRTMFEAVRFWFLYLIDGDELA